jgi:putative ABC transport system ATP-binding protein
VGLQNIKKTYIIGDAEFAVLKGINLDIKRGEFIALMGPSGSGKSTLMNIVGCLDRSTSGRFLLLGRDVSSLNDEELALTRREKLGFIFQTFNLIGRISVFKNVELPLVINEIPRKERKEKVMGLLTAVGLGHRVDYSPLRLSGGEKQRVAIARALTNDPEIIIADEPTGNLDLNSASEIMLILTDLNKDGKTIIMVTHNPEITENCSKVVRLRDGRIVEGAS